MDLTNEDVADILALLDSLPYDELDLETPRFRLTLRRTPDGSIQEFAMDYKRMVSGDAPMFMLHPQDVVYVPISKTKAILSSTTTLIGQTASASRPESVRLPGARHSVGRA